MSDHGTGPSNPRPSSPESPKPHTGEASRVTAYQPRPTEPPPRPRPGTPKPPFVVAAALTVLLSLAGCRGDDPSQSCSTPAPADGPSPSWSFRCEVKP